jgi:beta-fructofuranosidase
MRFRIATVPAPSLLAALAVLFAPPLAGAQVRFDFEPRAFVPGDHYVKDHAFVKAGDRYHIVYTTGTDSLGRGHQPGNEIYFGHASSPDLRHWTVHDPILAGPGPRAEWEERNRWAPHLVPRAGGGFRMYYTGVNRRVAQAIGLAEPPADFSATPGVMGAPDYFLPIPENPVFRPDTAWARWSPTSWANCRDPFVFHDAGADWILVTATARDGRGAIGLGRSTDGGRHFVDQGPLYFGQVGEALESPQLAEIDGRWFLLFSPDRRRGTWAIEGKGPRGPFDETTLAPLMNSIAPEILHDGNDVYLASHDSYRHQTGERRYYVLGFDRLRVGPRGLEIVPENGLGADWPEIEGDAFGGQPIIGDNPVARGDPSSGMVGRGYLSSRERFTWPPERSGDQRGRELTGRLRSRPLTIRGTSMTLLVGGNAGDSTYVALVRLADGEVLYRETGRGNGITMDLRRWDLTPFYGIEAVIEIADQDPQGWIDVDEILEHDARTGGVVPGVKGLLGATPNPFGDEVEIQIDPRAVLDRAPAPGPAQVMVSDVHGRLVRTFALSPPAWQPGSGVRWDGRNADGRPVASGVYFARLRGAGRESVLRLVRMR